MRQKGSYTVEMSFIMPLVILCVVLILYLSFYLHDRSVLRTEAARGALEAAARGEELPISEYRGLEKKLIMGSGTEVRQAVNGEEYTVTLSCRVKQPMPSLLGPFTPGGFKNLTASASSCAADPLLNIWKTRKKETIGKRDETEYADES